MLISFLILLSGLMSLLTFSYSLGIEQRSPETLETISYSEAESSGQIIFGPTLLIGWYYAPTRHQIPPSASDMVKHCTKDYLFINSLEYWYPGRKFYPASPGPGPIICEKPREKPEWRHSWPIIYWLNENRDSWCCQTTDQCKSLVTYWGATAGLCDMKDRCMKCGNVAFAVDGIMERCRDGGGKYVYEHEGHTFGVIVGRQEDRDLSQ